MSRDWIPPRRLRLWWLAARPKTLSLAAVPVVVGTALAWQDAGVVQGGPLIVALTAAVLIQIGTNLHNDAADFERGADLPGRTGPVRITAQGWASPGLVRVAAFACFGAATLGGAYLIWVGGAVILGIGLAALVAGWAYSGGVRPLSYTPLGELFVFLFFGLAAVFGSYWLQSPTVSFKALVAGAALGCMAAAVLMVNNYRDMDADEIAGRRTLAIALGRRASRIVYSALMLTPYVLVVALVRLEAGDGVWLALLALPLALLQIRKVQFMEPGPGFNLILAGTARTQAVFGILLAFGAVRWG